MGGAPRHVCHIFGSMDRGGAELRTLDVVRELLSDRVAPPFRFTFVCTQGRAGSLAPTLRELGCDVVPLPLTPMFPLAFAQLLKRRAIDVVHSHILFASGYVLAAARAVGVSCRIAHFRSCASRPEQIGRRLLRDIGHHLLDANATKIVGVSESVLDACWGPRWRRDGRCTVIYNGLPPAPRFSAIEIASFREKLGVAPHSQVLVHVGRFISTKNQAMAVRVLGAVRALGIPAVLLLVGGIRDRGVHREVLRSVEELCLESHVTLLGERVDVPEILAASDLFLFPSALEGLPGVVLEAASCGLPIVASSIPPHRELAGRLEGVSVCDLRADVAEWADAVVQQLKKESPRAVGLVPPFDLNTAVAGHAALWKG